MPLADCIRWAEYCVWIRALDSAVNGGCTVSSAQSNEYMCVFLWSGKPFFLHAATCRVRQHLESENLIWLKRKSLSSDSWRWEKILPRSMQCPKRCLLLLSEESQLHPVVLINLGGTGLKLIIYIIEGKEMKDRRGQPLEHPSNQHTGWPLSKTAEGDMESWEKLEFR